eukprot:6193618-Pleurochrysis_carterae.AAC.1
MLVRSRDACAKPICRFLGRSAPRVSVPLVAAEDAAACVRVLRAQRGGDAPRRAHNTLHSPPLSSSWA